MDFERLDVKVFAGRHEIGLDELIPVFHRWISDSVLDEVAVDVADYRHVDPGPGVLLVCHEGQYAFDHSDGEHGLLYSHRRGGAASDRPGRLRAALRSALAAAVRLEREAALAGRLHFPADRLLVRVNDRLAEAYDIGPAPYADELEALCRALFGEGAFTIEDLSARDRRVTFAVRTTAAAGAATLLARLERLPEDPGDTGRAAAIVSAAEPPAPLALPAPVADELGDWAREGYPEEVCGLLIGREVPFGGPAGGANGSGWPATAVRVERATLADNLAGDRRGDRFVLDPQAFVAADREASRQGLEIVGIWHTHPDHPPRPSRSDAETAWEGYSYLIVSVRSGRQTEMRSWRLQGEAFVEQPIEELEPR